jgi:hypothetical protein
MKKLSYEELYAELHGSDYKADLRDHVEQSLAVPVSGQSVIIAKVLDIEPVTQDFVDNNFDQVCKYVETRVSTIDTMMELCCDDSSDFLVIAGCLGTIEVCLQEIAVFNAFLPQLLKNSEIAILHRAQHILPHN